MDTQPISSVISNPSCAHRLLLIVPRGLPSWEDVLLEGVLPALQGKVDSIHLLPPRPQADRHASRFLFRGIIIPSRKAVENCGFEYLDFLGLENLYVNL